MSKCAVLGRGQEVSREGHKLCLPHWKAQKEGRVQECSKCGALSDASATSCQACAEASGKKRDPHADEQLLSSTKIGDALGLTAQKVNLILAELGWIEKFVKGWVPTSHGITRGAERRDARQTGVPYVVWPSAILKDRILAAAVSEMEGREPAKRSVEASGSEAVSAKQEVDAAQDFRSRFPAQMRAMDGHQVRSRAEIMICNWLYTQNIVHAYERRLPIDEEVYCDFYLPLKKVYIEYWGLEKDPKYAERMTRKIAIYAKYNLHLVELNDADIANLDDALPRKLLKYGVECL